MCLLIAGCVLSRRQAPVPHCHVFRSCSMNSSLVQWILLLPRSAPVPHPFFNQYIIEITEASSFYSLFSPSYISRTFLVLAFYRNSSFCRILHVIFSSSAAPSCCSIHPSHWVLLPCCYPQLINRHGWGCMNYPVAHSKWEQAGNRSHPHPEPQTPLGTLKPQYLQHGRQGSTFPCSTEGAWGKGILLLSHGVVRGQWPHSCKLQPFRKCLMQALWQPLLLQCFHFEKENRSNVYNSLNE